MTDTSQRVRIGSEIAERGAKLALDYYLRRDKEQDGSKCAPLDLVTDGDRAVEAQLKSGLAEAFPNDGFWGEETGGDPNQALWVADPIDGTSNFVAGLPFWGTSLAYVEDGETQIGFLVFPVLGLSYVATKGGGAFRNGKRLEGSGIDRLDHARVIFGRSPALDPANPLTFATGVLGGGAVIYAFNCCIYNLTRIAEGSCHAYYEERVHPWDYAAAGLIAREAGARVFADMSPAAYVSGGPLLAATPGLWDQVKGFAMMGSHQV